MSDQQITLPNEPNAPIPAVSEVAKPFSDRDPDALMKLMRQLGEDVKHLR